VFCCNTLPSRYSELGIDYESLRAVKPDLIWAAISAMGPDYPDAAGYDPAIQAQVGYMEVTGMLDGPPTLAGIPLVDLKAAVAEQVMSGRGNPDGIHWNFEAHHAVAELMLKALTEAGVPDEKSRG